VIEGGRVDTTPPGWHPDPYGRHEFRWWDGTRWTEHVSDRGAMSVDGGTTATENSHGTSGEQAGAGASRQVLLDTELRIGLRTKRLLVDDEWIAWGGDHVAYSSITALAWWITKVVAGPAHNFDYRIVMWEGKDQTKITFTGRADHVADAYARAVDALYQFAGGRILYEMLSLLDAGQTVAVAGLTLTRSGVTGKKQFLSWHTPLKLTNMFEWPGVYITDGSQPKAKHIAEVAFMQPNGPLVPPLLEACRRRYGSG
jgi:hypothetical protein